MKARVVLVRRLAPVALPETKTPGAVGFDIAAAEAATVPAHGFAAIRTGLALELPRDLEAQVRPRSGLAAERGIGILNSPGTIDPDYRGELKVVLFNLSGRPFRVRQGDRIAQLVFGPRVAVRFRETRTLSRTGRGKRGFGHTG